MTRGTRRIRLLYERVQQQCREAVHQGNLARAQALAGRAERVARCSGQADLRHRAVTNRSMVMLEVGDVAAAEKGLREVVLASSDDEVICRAAFYLASSLRRQKRLSRARFFARSAAERAEKLQDPLWRARCHNLLGNIELNRGDLSAARRAYGRALALWSATPGDHRFAMAIVLDNIGYGLTLEKREREGLPYLARALALALEIGDRRTAAECRQDLAHALLGLGSVKASRGNALQALALAHENSYRDIEQNCTYILGELAAIEGDDAERDLWFNRLQEMFPHVPHLREFLGMFDVCDLLTFH